MLWQGYSGCFLAFWCETLLGLLCYFAIDLEFYWIIIVGFGEGFWANCRPKIG